jgi:hypothetical protein
MMTNDICSYVDTSLVRQMKTWNLSNNSIKNTVYVSNIADAKAEVPAAGGEGGQN